jgi:hypothetical protein
MSGPHVNLDKFSGFSRLSAPKGAGRCFISYATRIEFIMAIGLHGMALGRLWPSVGPRQKVPVSICERLVPTVAVPASSLSEMQSPFKSDDLPFCHPEDIESAIGNCDIWIEDFWTTNTPLARIWTTGWRKRPDPAYLSQDWEMSITESHPRRVNEHEPKIDSWLPFRMFNDRKFHFANRLNQKYNSEFPHFVESTARNRPNLWELIFKIFSFSGQIQAKLPYFLCSASFGWSKCRYLPNWMWRFFWSEKKKKRNETEVFWNEQRWKANGETVGRG